MGCSFPFRAGRRGRIGPAFEALGPEARAMGAADREALARMLELA